jgi:hypothetical protein
LADAQARRAADLQAGRESLGEARRTRAFQHLLRKVTPACAYTLARSVGCVVEATYESITRQLLQ